MVRFLTVLAVVLVTNLILWKLYEALDPDIWFIVVFFVLTAIGYTAYAFWRLSRDEDRSVADP